MATTHALLETLIDTTFDSVEGYRKAADIATTPQLKSILNSQAAKRQTTLDTLTAELTRLGGDLITKGTATGELHQLWLKLTAMFESGDEAAVERVEEGEEYLAGKFEKALETDSFDAATASVVRAALAQIREGKRLADQLEEQYDD